MSPRTRRAVAAALTAAAVAALTACGAPLPQPTPPAKPAVAPAAVTPAQDERVLTSLGKVLEKGDEALDAKLLEPRVSGPALAIRKVEYVANDVTDGKDELTPIPASALTTIVPQTQTWPRTQLVITPQPDDLKAQRILVMRQSDPRSQYRMWAWARLLPGTEMPLTADPSLGSPVVAPDDDSLLMTPQQAVDRYTDVLAKGSKSTYASSFAEDAARKEIEDVRAATRKNLGDQGKLTERYEPSGAPVVAWRTVDGGAVVVGSFTTTSKVELTTDGTIPITDKLERKLTGKKEAEKSFARTFTDIVVLYVPPADADAPARLLAAEHALTKASAS
ncbi:hypothetical protein [Cellulomonas massiliensis]|uniref:hypothetical protein n=1 Tax=Cellulomonas massiliensis TaxID=1465811 RepID=UPI0003082AF5|nr:hypothetical protein [Cellulomonas massiliensis]